MHNCARQVLSRLFVFLYLARCVRTLRFGRLLSLDATTVIAPALENSSTLIIFFSDWSDFSWQRVRLDYINKSTFLEVVLDFYRLSQS